MPTENNGSIPKDGVDELAQCLFAAAKPVILRELLIVADGDNPAYL